MSAATPRCKSIGGLCFWMAASVSEQPVSVEITTVVNVGLPDAVLSPLRRGPITPIFVGVRYVSTFEFHRRHFSTTLSILNQLCAVRIPRVGLLGGSEC